MELKRITLLVLLFVNFSFANTIVNDLIVLPKENKITGTFSGDISDTDSFHLVFTKNKKSKKYEVFTYLFNGNTIDKLGSFITNQESSLVSFHLSKNILSLLLTYTKYGNSILLRVDIDLENKKYIHSKWFKNNDFVTLIRQKHRTVFIYNNENKLLIRKFLGNNKPTTLSYKYKNKKDLLKIFFKSLPIDGFSQDEFVANGSIKNMKAYIYNNQLIFTKDDNDYLINITEFLRIDLNNPALHPQVQKVNVSNRLNKKTSYFIDGIIYQISYDKRNMFFKFSDIFNNSNVLSETSLKEIKPLKINGNKDFKRFLFKGSRSKNKVTLTVNKTVKNNYKLRIDYVPLLDQYYNHTHLMYENFMMRQPINIPILKAPRGFGPSLDDSFYTYPVKYKKHYFEFVVDDKGKVLNDFSEKTIFEEIKKIEFIENLEETKKYDFISSCFLENNVRVILYDKQKKGFVIKTDKLK